MTAHVPELRHWIGGHAVGGAAVIENRSPADDDDLVALVASADDSILDAAATSARAALPGWARMAAPERGEILFRAAALLLDRMGQISRDLTREMGKPIRESIGEVRRAASILRYFAGQTAEPIGEVFGSSVATTRILTLRQPVGVVALITPWNFPIAIPAWKMAPALAYGNTVLFKPATATPMTANHLVRVLEDAGLPAGVVNLVYAPGAFVTERWIRHAGADAVSFTGSEAVGRELQLVATRSHLRVQLELGGKNAAIVAEDADLDRAADLIIRGAMGSAGQKCTATSRIIAVGSIGERLRDALVARLDRISVGDPLDAANEVGPVVDYTARNRIEAAVDAAAASGATVYARVPVPTRGAFARPALLGGIRDAGATIVQEEVFGPVLAMLEAEDVETAIRMHNGVAYGLSGSIFTRSLETAYRFIAASRVGIVHINGETPGAEPHVPFGGMKGSSSFSREQGKAAADFYTQTKTVYVESLPAVGLFDAE